MFDRCRSVIDSSVMLRVDVGASITEALLPLWLRMTSSTQDGRTRDLRLRSGHISKVKVLKFFFFFFFPSASCLFLEVTR